tara:strand:+ start:698 stop:1144 length:447 start_codon:yes stop_codon:yes gene_type:complete
MKSEPEAYSIDDLKKEKITLWDGIRNYQARNFMRDMNTGDKAFFYHSNCKPPAIVGLMEVIETHIIDFTQFDPSCKYYDPKSSKEKPRWDCAKLKYLCKFNQKISLQELREIYTEEDLKVIKKGNRLSILPVKNTIAHNLLKRLGSEA